VRLKSSCIAALLAFLLSGCGGGGSNNPAPPNVTIQSGNWNFSGSSTVSPGGSFIAGGSLNQTGASISGVIQIFSSLCFDTTVEVPVAGTVSGQTVTLSSSGTQNQTVTVNATGSATTISGSYTVTAAGCVDKGTVSANLVPPITGTWHGSFSSTVTSGAVINVTANLTQSATSDGHGFFPVTGTVTFSGSSCFTSGTIVQGLISGISGGELGLSVSTNDVPTPGATLISAVLDDPSTANGATGNYLVLAGNCSGDSGDGHITKP
jgi:hypothetical protein